MEDSIKKITGAVAVFFTSQRVIFWVYILIPVIATVQLLSIPMHMEGIEPHYAYNNFRIFKYSFLHLLEGRDLYIYHPDHYYDLYKYSPTFAVFMAPFAILPDQVGLFLWNALNCGVVYYGIRYFPTMNVKAKTLCLWFVMHELLLATQNSQSNALIAGLIILAHHQWEKSRPQWSSLLLLVGFFVKPFVIVAFVMWLFYDKKRHFVAYSAFWLIILILLPLLVISTDQFVFLYKSWFHLLANDHSSSYGISVMGLAKAFFGIDAKLIILTVGTIVFCIPLVKIRLFGDILYRQLYLASILIWVIIFNHRAESPTFIIAVCGAGIWYFTHPYSLYRLILLLVCLYITELSSSEVFFYTPWRKSFIDPYEIKALPCVVIWVHIVLDLLFKKADKVESSL